MNLSKEINKLFDRKYQIEQIEKRKQKEIDLLKAEIEHKKVTLEQKKILEDLKLQKKKLEE